MIAVFRLTVFLVASMLLCWPALARDAVETVRAAIAAENRKASSFPPDLYSPVFVSTFHRAIGIGPEAETTLTGLYTDHIRLLDARQNGNRVQARVSAKLSDTAKIIVKTITFFIAPDGRITDFDTHTQKPHGGQEPTALTNLRNVLAER